MYIPFTGEFYWIKDGAHHNSNMKAGERAGQVNSKGYLHIYFDGKSYKAHRLAYILTEGREPKGLIDHIDGNKLNNIWTNLRECNSSQNAWNQKCSKNNLLGVKGVRKLPSGSYFATITKGTERWTRTSRSLEAAVEWLSKKRKELHGKYARD